MGIDEISIEQLLELNALICQRIDELRARRDVEVLRRLRVGQQVHFDSAEGRIFGTLSRSTGKRRWS